MLNDSDGSEIREQLDKRRKELAARWQMHAEAHKQRMADSAAIAERLRVLERKAEELLRRRDNSEDGARPN